MASCDGLMALCDGLMASCDGLLALCFALTVCCCGSVSRERCQGFHIVTYLVTSEFPSELSL